MIFITGGTGFVGQYVVRALRDAGKIVRILARTPSGEEQLRGDVLEPDSIFRGMSGCDTVIHLVGIIRETGRQTFEAMHVQATENVIEAAKRNQVKRLVFMSALGTRPNARSRYHQTKWQAEELVRRSGIPYVIFRPSIILGKGDGFGTMLANLIRFSPGIVPVMGNGQNKFQPIGVNDVAACFAQAIGKGEYTLSGANVVTYNELLDLIMKTMRKKRFKVHLPIRIAKILAKLPGFPATTDQLLMLEEDNIGDNALMKRDFGINPTPLQAILSSYLR